MDFLDRSPGKVLNKNVERYNHWAHKREDLPEAREETAGVWWKVIVGRTEFAAKATIETEALAKVKEYYGDQIVVEGEIEVVPYNDEMQDLYNDTRDDREVVRAVVSIARSDYPEGAA